MNKIMRYNLLREDMAESPAKSFYVLLLSAVLVLSWSARAPVDADEIVVDQPENLPPVISASSGDYSLIHVENEDCMTSGFEVENLRHAMTDWDGEIVNAGWDIDLDGEIDYPVTESEGYTTAFIPLDAFIQDEDGDLEQSIAFGAQDDSGEWTSSNLYLKMKHDFYPDIEPCLDFEDVSEYSFSIVDHADNVSRSDDDAWARMSDNLVEITRTNGSGGLSWNSITFVIDGNYGVMNDCTTTSDRCQIKQTGDNNRLWEPGETIILEEEDSDLHKYHTTVATLTVEIYYDGEFMEGFVLNVY